MRGLFATAVGLAILVGAGTSEAIHKRGQPARKARGNVNPISQNQPFLQTLGITAAVPYPVPGGGKGVRVQTVVPGSRADLAGLESGDIIVQVDNTNLSATDPLTDLNTKLKTDQQNMNLNPPLSVIDIRDGTPKTLTGLKVNP